MAGSLVKSDRTPPIVWFFIGVFVFTWAFWVPGVLLFGEDLGTQSPLSNPTFLILQTVGAAGPSVVAYWLLRRDRRGSVKLVGAQYKVWRVGFVWYLVAAFLVPAILLAGLLIGGLLGDGPLVDPSSQLAESLDDVGVVGAIVTFLVIMVFALPTSPLLEEFGWRGFALTRLQDRYSALTASVILGLLWGLWHLPLTLGFQDPLVPSLLRITAITVLMTWVFNQTSGSMLVIMLFHASLNASMGLFSADAGRWPGTLLAIAVAGVVVAYNGRQDLGSQPRFSWATLTRTYSPTS